MPTSEKSLHEKLFTKNLFALRRLNVRDEFFWLGQINKASVVTNSKLGLLPMDIAQKTAKGIQTVIDSGDKPENRVTRVIQFEPKLIEAAGPEVTVLHIGRSSQDMHSTYRSAIMRDGVLRLSQSLEQIMKRLLELADQHRDTILPSYTNGVAAQPTTFAHYLLGFLEGFKRDHDRLVEFYRRLNVCPMGSCVLNGTGWPLDRQAMAIRLGFEQPTRNAFDATQISMTDLPVEFAQIQSSMGLHVGHFVADIMTQYAQPRPWILLAEANTYVSSAMPQKRNPGLMISVRGYASDIVSNAMGVLTRAHNTNTGMIDGKSTKIHRNNVDACIKMFDNFMKVLNSLVINKERALEELNLDWTASQEIADRLMHDHHLPFRIGHHVASKMVGYARSNGILPLTFPYSEMKRIYAEVIESEFPEASRQCPMTEDEFKAALNPREIINRRQTSGSANPSEVDRMIRELTTELESLVRWQENQSLAIDKAINDLDTEFNSFLK